MWKLTQLVIILVLVIILWQLISQNKYG